MMRSGLVPSVDCDLSLFGGVETFSVEHFFSLGTVKAFVLRQFEVLMVHSSVLKILLNITS